MATTQVKDGFQGGSDSQLKVNPDGSINVNASVVSPSDPDVNIHASNGGNITATGTSLDTNVTNIVPVTGPLTDTQLRATPVPVSGPLTDTQLRATPVPVSGPLTDAQLRATPVPVSAAQSGTWNINNVTGTVSLPTGASTSALQTTGNSSLSSIDGKLNSLGQKTSAASVPVVLASNQSPLNATTSAVTTFNATTTSAPVLALNASRRGAAFYNDSGGVIYLKLGTTASSTSYTIRMTDNTFYELPYPIYTGVIEAVSQSGTRSLRVTELT